MGDNSVTETLAAIPHQECSLVPVVTCVGGLPFQFSHLPGSKPVQLLHYIAQQQENCESLWYPPAAASAGDLALRYNLGAQKQ